MSVSSPPSSSSSWSASLSATKHRSTRSSRSSRACRVQAAGQREGARLVARPCSRRRLPLALVGCEWRRLERDEAALAHLLDELAREDGAHLELQQHHHPPLSALLLPDESNRPLHVCPVELAVRLEAGDVELARVVLGDDVHRRPRPPEPQRPTHIDALAPQRGEQEAAALVVADSADERDGDAEPREGDRLVGALAARRLLEAPFAGHVVLRPGRHLGSRLDVHVDGAKDDHAQRSRLLLGRTHAPALRREDGGRKSTGRPADRRLSLDRSLQAAVRRLGPQLWPGGWRQLLDALAERFQRRDMLRDCARVMPPRQRKRQRDAGGER